MGELVQLWHCGFLWKPSESFAIVTVQPQEDGSFVSECFVVVKEQREQRIEQHLRTCRAQPLPVEAVEAGCRLNPKSVAEEAVEWATQYFKSKSGRFKQTPGLVQLSDWKKSLLQFRWRDELPSSLLLWIGEKSRSSELQRTAKALLSVAPMTGSENPGEPDQN